MINEAVFKRQEGMGSRAHVEDRTLIGRGSFVSVVTGGSKEKMGVNSDRKPK